MPKLITKNTIIKFHETIYKQNNNLYTRVTSNNYNVNITFMIRYFLFWFDDKTNINVVAAATFISQVKVIFIYHFALIIYYLVASTWIWVWNAEVKHGIYYANNGLTSHCSSIAVRIPCFIFVIHFYFLLSFLFIHF